MIEESSAPNQPQVDALRKWLIRELSQILDISQEALATNKPLSYFGLDSAQAVGLIDRLGNSIGRKLSIALVWEYPTIEALAAYLSGNEGATSRKSPAPLLSASAWNQSIAVIGLSCRFPGASEPGAFWDLLRSGSSAFREITSDRWDVNAWYDPDVDRPGMTNARQAGLLDRIDEFDPAFFGISPREATEMDPQQRLALELTWEALEDAGLRPDVLRGSRTGVFVGAVWHDYEALARKAGAEITAHSGTGQALSIVANRISYALGLQGPSMALDTACSSSLVSVHLACRSLQAGDAALAIAGGVNIIIDPETMVTLSKFGGLSPTDELRAFDARANGFVRGEGGGLIVLKSLNQALADGDPIYAVIRGSAVNNDGASNGLTAPNPKAQELVLAEACARAGVKPSNVHYVEAHGTGTPLGDPIEAHALGTVFGNERAADQPLLIGSVKTNIGHLEGASGIAGLIKLILSLHHRQIPPSLNFETPNPHIDFAASNLRVVSNLELWPESRTPVVGGTSAFGWGGTNCHIIVEEAERSSAHLLPLSAPDPVTLKATAEKLRSYLQSKRPDISMRDVCATAARRISGVERVALTARSASELNDQLQGFLLGQKRPGVAVGRATPIQPTLAFVFSPQGSQWLGMGRSLMAVEPVFRAKLAECDQALRDIAGWSLFDELLSAPTDSRLNRVEFVQPTLCSIQIALAALWNLWGIQPDFVAAHSLGEWAAACVAGALSIEETIRVVVESSRAQASSGNDGGMAVVELAASEAQKRIGQWADEVFIAGYNSPTSTILSGDSARLNSMVKNWKEEGLTCSLIDVSVAAHSPRMDPACDRLKESLRGLRPRRTAIPLVSSINGDYLRGVELDSEHWAQHVRQPVLFTQVIERLAADGCTIFLEIGPHPLLRGSIQQTLRNAEVDGLALSSCRRGDDERGSLLNSLGTLYALGRPVAWPEVTRGGRDDLSLPIPAIPPRERSQMILEPPLLLPLSGRTAIALRDRARSLAKHIRSRQEVAAKDIVYVAAARRQHLEHRLALVGTTREELSSALERFASEEDPVNLVSGCARGSERPKVGFICSGQGPQWWGMGRELLATTPIFRQELARCADEIKRYAAWDLLEEMARDEASSRLGETEIAQPALFALQVALAAVWRSWGIQPDALVGHSVGEVAAAYLGGALSFADAVKVIFHRGRLMQRATGLGKMAAIELPESDVEKLLSFYRDRVSIAAVNSPASTVISGEAGGIDEIVATAKKRGVRTIVLPVNYAFHSPPMEPIAIEMAGAVSGLKVNPVSVPVYSTVTGALSTDFTAEYWGRNIRRPVLFAAAMRAMLDDGISAFVELSPHPVLSGMVDQCAKTVPQSVKILPSLRRDLPERFQMVKSLGALFADGAEIDWRGVYPLTGQVVSLPPYPWQRKRFWLEQNAPTIAEAAPDLVAEATANWFYEVDWEEKSRADDPSVRAVTRRLPTPEALEAAAQLYLLDHETESPPGHGAGARDDIEILAAHFAAAALVRLGLEYSPSRHFSSAALAKQLGVRTRHAHLLDRMLEMLVEEQLLKQTGTQFETASAFQDATGFLESIANQADSLRRKNADFATEFELLARCGANLAGVLRGEVDPLQLLFPSDGSVNAERLYRESFSARLYNQLLGELVANAAQTASLGQTVRLLELGAGTGSTTTSVLERLAEVRATYCFTDVSRLLLNEARTRFSRFSSVSYATLDIEKPLETQDFKPGAYDIVLASNVLHATADLRTALKHVRQLLAPGGLLLVCETTAPRRWLDLIFGLTEGWNRFTDTELRTTNALLGADQWLRLLNASGFQATVSVGSAFSAGAPHEQTVLVAKADDQPLEGNRPEPETATLSAKGRWLIFSDTGGLAEVVAQQLEQSGGETVLVEAGDRFEERNPNRVTINPDDSEDYHRLLENHGIPWRGVLHAWSLDTAVDQADALSGLDRAERLGSRSALFLIRALTEIEGSQAPKLWFLTRGAQPAWLGAELESVAQSPVWGLGRTVALENPKFWGGLIDVAVGAEPRILARRIALEISLPDGEDQIALSEELRMVPRLLSTSPPAPAPTIVKPDSAYLITGGLGSLGPHIAEWLARNGARELILCSRRVLPARENWGELNPSQQFYEQVAAIQKFEKMGIKVRVEKVDVADREQAESLFFRIRDSRTALRGIVHAAADIKLCALQEMGADGLHAALRAKVEGTWWLHQFSREFPLDFFVLFSSTAALFGAPLLGHYAAANQFLDSFARWRRAAGLPALSVNWGTWEEIRALGENRDEAERFGLKGMPAHLALQALSFLVTAGVAQRLVADVDWELFKPAVETRGPRPFFARIRTKPTTIDGKPEPTGWIKRLEGTAPEDRRESITTLIAAESRRILGFHGEDHLDLDRGLFELGMDSLMSVQLKGRLEKSIGCALPATLTFTYPTVHALADFLLNEVLKLSIAGKVDLDSTKANAEAPDEELADLSDEEIKTMLSAELSSLPRDLRD